MTETATETKEYTMLSTPMISAVAILQWAISGYHFKKDRPKLLNVVQSWEGPSKDVYHRLLSGQIEWKEVDGNVVFTA